MVDDQWESIFTGSENSRLMLLSFRNKKVFDFFSTLLRFAFSLGLKPKQADFKTIN